MLKQNEVFIMKENILFKTLCFYQCAGELSRYVENVEFFGDFADLLLDDIGRNKEDLESEDLNGVLYFTVAEYVNGLAGDNIVNYRACFLSSSFIDLDEARIKELYKSPDLDDYDRRCIEFIARDYDLEL